MSYDVEDVYFDWYTFDVDRIIPVITIMPMASTNLTGTSFFISIFLLFNFDFNFKLLNLYNKFTIFYH